ncbi:MAG: Na+/H+ antiporter NhaA [Dehalococcoidia bacterium]|nr:Na+/H+ antiporter NhaA [Dehalococcoidia bacterium]
MDRSPRRTRPALNRLVEPLQEFVATEAAGGLVLLAAAIVALVWANSAWSSSYDDLLHHYIVVDLGFYRIDESVHFWVNDVLMVLFFFLVGMEIKRELVIGEISSVAQACVPLAAALGGMILPVAIFLAIAGRSEGGNGWGVPMATDIAFALGIAALAGPRVPTGLKVLVLALAIFDDLGAVAVIAVAYGESIHFGPLALGLALLLAVYLMNRAGVRELSLYVIAGLVAWAAIVKSGVHPTTVGVALGVLTPLDSRYPLGHLREEAEAVLRSLGDERTAHDRQTGRHHHAEAILRLRRLAEDAVAPLIRLEHGLNYWVAFVVVPTFALANAGVDLRGDTLSGAFSDPLTWGIALGLVLGKPLGIILGAWIAVRLGARLPNGATWRGVVAVGAIAGIGFTVALFVAELAYADSRLLAFSKVAILSGSVVSGCVGYILLKTLPAEATS